MHVELMVVGNEIRPKDILYFQWRRKIFCGEVEWASTTVPYYYGPRFTLIYGTIHKTEIGRG